MEANLMMALVVFGILFLTLAAGIWVGFSLFIVGFMGRVIFCPLPAGNKMGICGPAALYPHGRDTISLGYL